MTRLKASAATLLVLLLTTWQSVAVPPEPLTTSQPTAAECSEMAAFRDGALFTEWDAQMAKMGIYRDAFKAVGDARTDLLNTKSDLHIATGIGTFIQIVKLHTDLIQNLVGTKQLNELAIGRYAKFKSVTSKLNSGKKLAATGSEGEFNYELTKIAADIVLKQNIVGRSFIAIRDLALDSKDIKDSIELSSQIQRQLASQMPMLERQIGDLEKSLAKLDTLVKGLTASKDKIDELCGNRGCPMPGSTPPSRKGTTVCLVNVSSFACVGCKEELRHRCEANSDGEPRWKPVDECLGSEGKNARLAQSGVPQVSYISEQLSLLTKKPSTTDKDPNTSSSRRTQATSCNDLAPDVSDLLIKFEKIYARFSGDVDPSLMLAAKRRQTIDEMVQLCGNLEVCVRASREQVRESRRALSESDCTFSSLHAANCEIFEINIEANQRILDWLVCHQSHSND